jgi:hypothetical protein
MKLGANFEPLQNYQDFSGPRKAALIAVGSFSGDRHGDCLSLPGNPVCRLAIT